MNSQPNQPINYPISNEDKEVIRELGRKLHKFILDEATARHAEHKGFHVKYMLGALEYVQRIFGEKANMVAEDLFLVQDSVERFDLHGFIEEPFKATPMPTREELKTEALNKKEEAEKDLALLDATADVATTVTDAPANDTASPESEAPKEPVAPAAPTLSPIQPSDLGGGQATA